MARKHRRFRNRNWEKKAAITGGRTTRRRWWNGNGSADAGGRSQKPLNARGRLRASHFRFHRTTYEQCQFSGPLESFWHDEMVMSCSDCTKQDPVVVFFSTFDCLHTSIGIQLLLMKCAATLEQIFQAPNCAWPKVWLSCFIACIFIVCRYKQYIKSLQVLRLLPAQILQHHKIIKLLTFMGQLFHFTHFFLCPV